VNLYYSEAEKRINAQYSTMKTSLVNKLLYINWC